VRYDPHEKTHGQPLPHLFARRVSTRHEVISLFAIRNLLNATADWAGLTDNGRLILADQAAEDGPTPNRAVDRLWNKRIRTWRTQLQHSMRPPRVVVRGKPGKHPTQMPLAEDQHPVGDLGPHGQHEPFGEAVSPADTAAES
jgi:hypothetical protein